jgi:hypothetical protein
VRQLGYDAKTGSTTGGDMIARGWIKKQVFSLGISELKKMLGLEKIRFSKNEVVLYLECLASHHFDQLCFTEVHKANEDRLGVRYSAFMVHMNQAGQMVPWLFEQHKKQAGIDFDKNINIIDATLLPMKEEKSITQKDWGDARVTVRTKKAKKSKECQASNNSEEPKEKKKADKGEQTFICGEKALLVTRTDRCIVHAELMSSINESEMNVLKQPMVLATLGLRSGILLADKGFACKVTRKAFNDLNQSPLNLNVDFIAPYSAKSKIQLTLAERLIYKLRWEIETVFGILKHKRKRFRLTLAEVRSKILISAKFFLSILAFNLSFAPSNLTMQGLRPRLQLAFRLGLRNSSAGGAIFGVLILESITKNSCCTVFQYRI